MFFSVSFSIASSTSYTPMLAIFQMSILGSLCFCSYALSLSFNHCLYFPWILGSNPPFLLGFHFSFPTAYSMFHVEDLQAHQSIMSRACTNLNSAFFQSSSSFCILYCSDWPSLTILSLCLTGIFKSFLNHANSVYISFFKIFKESQLLTW